MGHNFDSLELCFLGYVGDCLKASGSTSSIEKKYEPAEDLSGNFYLPRFLEP